MLHEDPDALARKAACDALGRPVPDDVIDHAMCMHAFDMTEDLADRLAALTAESETDRRRRRALAGEIDHLKIVLAVRAADPSTGIQDEIRINTQRWPTREAPTLTVSLDCLANVLEEECPGLDPEALVSLMASICRRAAGGFGSDPWLAEREAYWYAPEDDGDENSPEAENSVAPPAGEVVVPEISVLPRSPAGETLTGQDRQDATRPSRDQKNRTGARDRPNGLE